jgi:adenylate cyclase
MKRKQRFWLSVLVLWVLLFLWNFFPITSAFRRKQTDFRYALFNRDTKAARDVVVVDIDEASLKIMEPLIGRWPWPRSIYKDLLEFLYAGDSSPKAVLFDVLFSERMLGSDQDLELAEVSGQRGTVFHSALLLESEVPGVLPLPDGLAERHAVRWAEPPTGLPGQKTEFRDYAVSLNQHYRHVPGYHVVTHEPDKDGTFRRSPMLFRYGTHFFPSLSLLGVMATVTEPKLRYADHVLHVLGKSGEDIPIPLDGEGKLPLHYYRTDRGPEMISIGPLLRSAWYAARGQVEENPLTTPEEFKDRIVIIGGSAAGLWDLKVTPVSPTMPGALLHATNISNILMRDHLASAPWWLNLLFLGLTGTLTYGVVLFLESVLLKIVVPLIVALTSISLNVLLFRYSSYSLEWVGLLPMVVVILLDGFVYLHFVEGRDKRRLHSVLSKYLSPHIARDMVEKGTDPTAEVGRQEELTILFSDIRGFTHYSEQRDPREVVATLNAYLKEMTETVFAHSGTLDKFLGDGMLAFWGAPLADADHAFHAVQCALEMQRRMVEWRKATGTDFRVGIGIHTGRVVVGNIGSSQRLEYTVIGDTVNLASRLEGAAKQLGESIVVSEATWLRLSGRVLGRDLGAFSVRGRDESVKVFAPTALALESTPTVKEDDSWRKIA